MTFEQEDIFQYLLSLPSTNLYSEVDDNRGRSGYHGLFEQALDNYLVHNGAKTYLTSIVNHNRFDVNEACHRYGALHVFDTSNFTCLFIALKRLDDCLRTFEVDNGASDNEGPNFTEADSRCLDRYMYAIKLLLEAGADPNQNILGGISSGIDLVESWLRVSQPNASPRFQLIDRVFRQLLAMMREAQAP